MCNICFVKTGNFFPPLSPYVWIYIRGGNMSTAIRVQRQCVIPVLPLITQCVIWWYPSCSYYYLLSPSTLFFAHLIVLHFLFHCTFYSYLSFFYHIYALVLCYFYIICICILLHCPLSGPDLIYISLLIIPSIIYYVTNKETLNLETMKQLFCLIKMMFSSRFSICY